MSRDVLRSHPASPLLLTYVVSFPSISFQMIDQSSTFLFQNPTMASHLGAILVVGGCGFLGHNTVRELLQHDSSASISVLDLRTDTNRHPSVSYHSADITQKPQVEAVFAKVKPKTVFHTVSPHPLQRDRHLLYTVNVIGTRNLVACAQQAGTAAFVYTSST